jgi:lipopolysaccharide export system permease protein
VRLFRIIDRYVFLEAFGLYVLGFSGFLGFLIINKLFLEAPRILDPHLPWKAIVLIVLLETPYFMTLSFPVSILFATLMSMGRLAKDNELMAMFTNGISLYRLFLPFLILSLCSSVCSYFTNEYLLTSASAAKQKIYDSNPQILQGEYENDPYITRLANGDFISAASFDKQQGRLVGVVYDDFTNSAGKRMIVAQSGVATGENLTLGTDMREPAIIYDRPSTGGLYDSYSTNPSYQMNLGLDLRRELTAMKTPQELSQTELAEQSKVLQQRGESQAVYLTDFHLRFSGPFASLAFALVAMPLSLRAPRDERLLGLIYTFLLVMTYYVIYFVCKLMGHNEFLPPWLAAWLMNIVFGVISLFIFLFSRK